MIEQRCARKRTQQLGVHVPGAADLGVSPNGFAAELVAARRCPTSQLWARLGQPSRVVPPGEHPYAMSPLHAAVQARCEGLLLIATGQTPPHPGDSWPLAQLMLPLLRKRGMETRIAVVDHFDLDRFRMTARDEVRSFEQRSRPDEVVLIVGGGPEIGFVGALLGIIQAGGIPRLLKVPREGEPLGQPMELPLDVNLLPWLVCTHQYALVAQQPGINERERRAWSAMASAEALNWRGMAEVAATDEDIQQLRKSHPEIQIPGLPGPPADGQPPVDERGWRWHRRTLQASLLVRASDDPLSALYLTRPWTERRVLELAFRDPANRDHPLVAALRAGDHGALAKLLKNRHQLAAGPIRDFLDNVEAQTLCQLGSEASHGKLQRSPIGAWMSVAIWRALRRTSVPNA